MTTEAGSSDRLSRSVEEHAYWAFEKLGRHDLSSPEEIWAADAVDHFLPVRDAVGREAIVVFLTELFAAFPDLRIEVENVVASGSHAVVQWHGTGTFTGEPFQGIRPTGRRVDFRACDIVELQEDNLVRENTIYWDGARFARQIGMLPEEGSALDRLMLATFNVLTWLRTLGGRRLQGRR